MPRLGFALGLAASLAAALGCGDDESDARDSGLGGLTPSSGGSSSAGAAGRGGAGGGAGGGSSAGTPSGGTEGSLPDNTPLNPGGAGGSTGSSASSGDAGVPADAGVPPVEPPTGFAPCPTDGTACRIMPLGDSITFGLGSSHQGAYRLELFRQAVLDDHNITFVGTNPGGPQGPAEVEGQPFPRNHEGISGDTIPGNPGGFPPGVRNRVDAAITATNPNIILLHIGTNDANGTPPNDILDNLGALIDQIIEDAPDALLVVAQIIPRQQNHPPTEAYNAGIPALVEERAAQGDHVISVDMFTPFASTPNFANALLADFVHPNDAGYVIMAETWYEAIEGFLP